MLEPTEKAPLEVVCTLVHTVNIILLSWHYFDEHLLFVFICWLCFLFICLFVCLLFFFCCYWLYLLHRHRNRGGGGTGGMCPPSFHGLLLTTLYVASNCAPPIKKSFLRLCIALLALNEKNNIHSRLHEENTSLSSISFVDSHHH